MRACSGNVLFLLVQSTMWTTYRTIYLLFYNSTYIIYAILCQTSADNAKLAWTKATDPQIASYKFSLARELSTVNLPAGALTCHNLHCSNVSHFDEINAYCDSLYTDAVAMQATALYQSLVMILDIT
jgi:hypothetical protein